MPNIGVILSGCGVFDGSEIQEAVITLPTLDQRGAKYQCMAPSKPFAVVDHLKGQPAGGTRNVLTESARIARGKIIDLATVKASDYDGFILPGGFGAAKNLSTFAEKGPDMAVDPHVARVLTDAHNQKKPIGFICIAPAIAAKLFGDSGLRLTIGHDKDTAGALEKMGVIHVACDVSAIVADDKERIVSTPAYMEAKSIKDLYAGIDGLVGKVLEMAAKG